MTVPPLIVTLAIFSVGLGTMSAGEVRDSSQDVERCYEECNGSGRIEAEKDQWECSVEDADNLWILRPCMIECLGLPKVVTSEQCFCKVCLMTEAQGFCGDDLIEITRDECESHVCNSNAARYRGGEVCQKSKLEQAAMKGRGIYRNRRKPKRDKRELGEWWDSAEKPQQSQKPPPPPPPPPTQAPPAAGKPAEQEKPKDPSKGKQTQDMGEWWESGEAPSKPKGSPMQGRSMSEPQTKEKKPAPHQIAGRSMDGGPPPQGGGGGAKKYPNQLRMDIMAQAQQRRNPPPTTTAAPAPSGNGGLFLSLGAKANAGGDNRPEGRTISEDPSGKGRAVDVGDELENEHESDEEHDQQGQAGRAVDVGDELDHEHESDEDENHKPVQSGRAMSMQPESIAEQECDKEDLSKKKVTVDGKKLDKKKDLDFVNLLNNYFGSNKKPCKFVTKSDDGGEHVVIIK